ncbi:hypothetical protein GJ496_001912 [Pomphorhynchus laevis]|nr:hypothetical protein GJ496_001912 [Pomphorhynchus laevis]
MYLPIFLTGKKDLDNIEKHKFMIQYAFVDGKYSTDMWHSLHPSKLKGYKLGVTLLTGLPTITNEGSQKKGSTNRSDANVSPNPSVPKVNQIDTKPDQCRATTVENISISDDYSKPRGLQKQKYEFKEEISTARGHYSLLQLDFQLYSNTDNNLLLTDKFAFNKFSINVVIDFASRLGPKKQQKLQTEKSNINFLVGEALELPINVRPTG